MVPFSQSCCEAVEMKQCRMSVKLTAIPARQMPLCSRLMTDTGDLEDPHSLSSGSRPESQLARGGAGSGPRLPGTPGSTASLLCHPAVRHGGRRLLAEHSSPTGGGVKLRYTQVPP